MNSSFDIVFENCTIIDGTGGDSFRGSVAVTGDKIAAVGDHLPGSAAKRIDVAEQVMAPGFIDIHSHSDFALLVDPRAQSKIRQGVTTEVVGNCSFSPAPVNDINRHDMAELNSYLTIGGDITWDWRTMGDYIQCLEDRGIALNVVPLVGHGPIKSAAMGYEKRHPTADELAQMKRFAAEAMDDGVLGFSSGLIYPPSSYADTDELVAIVSEVAAHGGIYFTHVRGEGVSLLRAIAEAIEISERTGAPVQIAHHKAVGVDCWGRVHDSLAMIDSARDRGVDVTVDVYPYTSGSSFLTRMLPESAMSGGVEAMVARLSNPDSASLVQAEIESQNVDWDGVTVSWVFTEENASICGMTVSQIADGRSVNPARALIDIIAEEEGRAAMVIKLSAEEDMRFVLQHPASMIGSDGMAICPSPPLGNGRPHPRSYGTFPRVLGRYAGVGKLLSLESAVHKMTGLPAEKMGLRKKGRVEVGRDADLVVFDQHDIRDEATYDDPHRFPTGITHVMVNGALVVDSGRQTDALAGRVIQRAEGIYDRRRPISSVV